MLIYDRCLSIQSCVLQLHNCENALAISERRIPFWTTLIFVMGREGRRFRVDLHSSRRLLPLCGDRDLAPISAVIVRVQVHVSDNYDSSCTTYLLHDLAASPANLRI